MKNIHVTVNYEIRNMYNSANSHTKDYARMAYLCSQSFKKNLKGLDESIILTGSKRSYDEVFKDIFYKLMDMHKDGCNLLFTDADTVCVKKTTLFGSYDNFNMFGIDNRFCKYSGKVSKELYKDLNPWFMSNLRYFPNTMDSNLWNIGKALADKWINVWAYECIIYNRMIYSQEKQNIIQEMNSQWIDGKKPEGANIIHLAGSRSSKRAIILMEDMLK